MLDCGSDCVSGVSGLSFLFLALRSLREARSGLLDVTARTVEWEVLEKRGRLWSDVDRRRA